MAYDLQAFAAKNEVLEAALFSMPAYRLISMRQGFAMLIEPELDYDREVALTPEIEQLGLGISARGPVAYIAASYFGGEGEQSSIAWKNGKILHEFEVARSDSEPSKSVISIVLKAIGVVNNGYHDEFAALGLDLHRDHDDWIWMQEHGSVDDPA